LPPSVSAALPRICYGRSSSYHTHADYALAHSVHDMLDLLAHLGRERAIWVGHDWGSPVVWSPASHHPQRSQGLAIEVTNAWPPDVLVL